MAAPAKANSGPSGHEGLEVHATDLPFELDAGLGQRARIGLIVLANDQTIEHEFRRILNIPGVDLYHSRIAMAPEVTPDSLAAMAEKMSESAALIMPGLKMDVMAYACTSGAMVIGPAAVREMIQAQRPGIPVTTPMEAAVEALKALGARRVCFIPPYAEEINLMMRRYLLEAGFAVPVMASWNQALDDKVARISPKSIKETVCRFGGDGLSDAIFVACTSMRMADFVEELEQDLGKPVISSDLAMAWHCLRLAGCQDKVEGLGRLMRTELA